MSLIFDFISSLQAEGDGYHCSSRCFSLLQGDASLCCKACSVHHPLSAERATAWWSQQVQRLRSRLQYKHSATAILLEPCTVAAVLLIYTAVLFMHDCGLQEATAKIDEYARGMISGSGSTLFEELGLYYIGPIDGHNLDDLIAVLQGIPSRPVWFSFSYTKG